MLIDLVNRINIFVSRIQPTDEQESEFKTLINKARTIQQDSKLIYIINALNELEKDFLDNGSFLKFDPHVIDDVIEIIKDYI